MIALRPYQKEAVEAILQALRDGQNRQCVCLPCGTGKTVIFSHLAGIARGRVLIVAHRKELLEQARDKLILAGIDASEIGIVKATDDETDRRFVVASIQTLSRPRRLHRFDPDDFSLIVVDECHHSAADSYRTVLSYFHPKLTLGVSATLDRHDGKGLADIFGDKPVFTYETREAIADEWLCVPRQYQITTDVDLSAVHSRGDDFVPGELATAVNDPIRNKLVVESWETKGGQGRPTVVFAVTVAHAEALAAMFNERGHRGAVVHANTPDNERETTLKQLAAGEIDAVCNVGILTEGWDCPPVSCVCMARPTRSRGLYQQMFGRGLRPCDGKADCLVLDITDNCQRHKIVTIRDLFGVESEDFDGQTLDEVECAEKRRAEKKAQRIALYKSIHARVVNPIAPEILDGYSPRHAWEREPATESQLKTLHKLQIDCNGHQPTKGEASFLLSKEFDRRDGQPPTPSQKWFLKCANKWRTDLNKRTASILIGELKQAQVD